MKQVLARLHHEVPSLSNTANIKFSQYNKHLTDVQQTVGRLLQQQREQCYNLFYAFATEAEEQQRLCGITLFGAVERLQERVTQLETRTVRPAVERLVQQYYKPQVEKNQALSLALAEAEETATQTALLVQLTESKNKGLEEQIRSFRNNVQTQQLLVQTSEELRAVKQVTTTALRDAVRDLTAICQHAPSDVLSNDFMKTIRTSALKTEAYVELYYKNSRSNASPETHRTATPPSYVYQRQTPTSGQRAREAPHGTPPPLVPSRYGNTTPKVQFQLPNGNKENVGASTPYENRFPETVKTSHQKAVYTDMLQLIHTPPTSLLPQNNNNNNNNNNSIWKSSRSCPNSCTILLPSSRTAARSGRSSRSGGGRACKGGRSLSKAS
ncbi:hypothetical protein ADEAN_000305800 [Angomonas deanei]|uniref:Uncharacterized protein n=1 Tax=Angomonas deanei TaxID=59799 RepID=A0A7G2CA17_9TRYP|nr:hypothetical protein ADEAN_000305800 [Angomonas deanei]